MSEVIESGGLTADENAFFESGGEKPIPAESGDAGGSSSSAGADSGAASGDAKPAAGKAAGGDPVPLATFLSEKNARKELDKQNREMAQQLAELKGKFSVLDRLAPAAANDAKPVAPPTVEEDIFGAVKHVGETVTQLQKRLDDEAAAKTANEKQVAEQNAFVNNYRQDAATFEVKTPDFKAAYNFLLSSRASELIAIGYDDPKALQDAGAPIEEVQAAAKALHEALTADEYAIAQMGFAKQKSPAELIYNLAKQRGYNKPNESAAAAGKGAAQLETIERGQAANKSLSATGGSSGDADMTAERLIGLPMDEFEAWVEKNPAKARRIMGG